MSKLEAIEPNETKLANALQFVDCIAQEGLSEIISIASISIAAMTNPEFWSNTSAIETIMRAIRARADDLMNTINCEAEAHSCNWANYEPSRARHDAHEAYVKNRAAFLQQVRGGMTNAAVVQFKDYGGGIREATKRIKWSVPMGAPCKPDDLSFTTRDEQGRMVWWDVAPPKTDYWSVHQMLGRAYAFELLDLLNNPAAECHEHILSFVIAAMFRSAQRSGDWRETTMVEGFFEVVSEYISTGKVAR